MSNDKEFSEKIESEVLGKYTEMKESKPSRRGQFVGSEADKFYVALSEEAVYELSPLAYYVWVLCDGDHTVEDMVTDISTNAKVEYHEVVEPLIIVLDEMKKAGLVDY
ncbi:MAG: PqqD family protein [Desulfurococcaceae archaeon]